LVMPAQLPGIAVERDDRRGVQVVAFAGLAVIVGAGIASPPENQIQFRIVRASRPCRSAAVLPRLRVKALPRSMAGVFGTGGGGEPPRSFAGANVVGIDEAANALFVSGHTRNALVLEGDRRRRAAVAVAIILHLGVPENRAALHADGDDVGVERRFEEAVAHHRK